MIKQYTLNMPGAVYSGEGSLEKIKMIVPGRFGRAVVFTDKGVEQAGIVDYPVELLKQSGVEVSVLDGIPSEPTCEEAQTVVDTFREMQADLIVAIGGGSVMDIAKLASIAAGKEYGIRDLLENPKLGRKQVKTLMIPTTAGTGSEATPNSIVAVPEKEVKVGIVNEEMIADYVILDGSTTRNLPEKIAAATGVDALAHAIECFTSKKANPFSNLFAMEALKLIFSSLEKACRDSSAVKEKTDMLTAAFYAGVAIASSGTTAVHALSYPLGGKYHIPHGVANAMLLMPVMRYNSPECVSEFAEAFDAVEEGGGSVTGREEKAVKFLSRMEQLVGSLPIPASLKEYGIGPETLESLVDAGLDVRRLLDNNKKAVTREAAKSIYLEIM